jgi:ABC-type branched-subunit amino acid transport system substrate-binding protein
VGAPPRGPLRALALAAAALFGACTAAPAPAVPTPVATHEPNTVNVTALLDLSGPRTPSGQPQRNAMQIWLDQQQSGVRLKVKFVDVAGSDAKLYVELRHAAVDDGADAVVIGVPLAIDATFAQALQVASVPVLITTPVADPAASAGGRFTFALAPTPEVLARATAADITARGRLAPMLLVGDDTNASIVERNAFAAELRRMGITPPTPVILSAPDGPMRVRNAAAVATSVALTGAAAPYSDAIRAMPTGSGGPLVYLSYLTETGDLLALRDQSANLMWPGAIATTSATTGAGASFIRAYTDRYGAPSTLAASAFDALSLIDAAAEAAPTELDAARLRLRVEQLTFAGVVTRYSFTPARHVGFASADLAFLQWNGARSVPVLAPPAKPVVP